jgi:tetratricopeptide (TPR) repeat protein
VKLSALFAIALSLAWAGASSHQASDASAAAPTKPSSSQDSSAAPMTPQQTAQMRGDILMARKDYREAALAYQRLLDKDPQNAQVLNKVGIAYEELGEASLAERFYKKALRADPKSGFALNNLGTIEYSRERFGKAIKYYKKALALGGDNLAPVYTNLGYAYCNVKMYPKAMESFSQALALDPNIFEPKGTSGSLLQHRSTADPGTLYFLVAKSYAKLGDAERAARYLKLARDDGYKDFLAAEKDPDFARVIKDPQVQDVLHRRPAYEAQKSKPITN